MSVEQEHPHGVLKGGDLPARVLHGGKVGEGDLAGVRFAREETGGGFRAVRRAGRIEVHPARDDRLVVEVMPVAAQGDHPVVVPVVEIEGAIAEQASDVEAVAGARRLEEFPAAGHRVARGEQLGQAAVLPDEGDLQRVVVECAHAERGLGRRAAQDKRGVFDRGELPREGAERRRVEHAGEREGEVVCGHGGLVEGGTAAGGVPHGIPAQVEGPDKPVARDLTAFGEAGDHLAVGKLAVEPLKGVGDDHAGGRVGRELGVEQGNARGDVVADDLAGGAPASAQQEQQEQYQSGCAQFSHGGTFR